MCNNASCVNIVQCNNSDMYKKIKCNFYYLQISFSAFTNNGVAMEVSMTMNIQGTGCYVTFTFS